MKKFDNLICPSPADILRFFVFNWDNTTAGNRLDDTIIILGRPGPTGKTWLCNKLKEYGFNAIEISEDIYQSVLYNDEYNRIRRNLSKNCTVIILNQPLSKGEME